MFGNENSACCMISKRSHLCKQEIYLFYLQKCPQKVGGGERERERESAINKLKGGKVDEKGNTFIKILKEFTGLTFL